MSHEAIPFRVRLQRGRLRMMALLISALVVEICYPFALVRRERLKAKHSYVGGRQLVFTGSAWVLFGHWMKWLLLTVVTLGVYALWVGPRIQKWKYENTALAGADPGSAPHPWSPPAVDGSRGSPRQTPLSDAA